MLLFPLWKANPRDALHYYNGWSEDIVEEVEALKDIIDTISLMKQATEIALAILTKLPQTLGIVCGPISSGKRSLQEQLHVFDLTVQKVSNTMPVFNQMPFEPIFGLVHERIKNDETLCPMNQTSKFFIDNFYRKVFFSGKEWVAHFIHDWEHSVGASIEHEIFTSLKSEIIYLPANFAE